MEKEIIEGNEIIAGFMGSIYSPHADAWGFGNARVIAKVVKIGEVEYKDLVQAERFEIELKYHSSWDWLMPVVKECLCKSNELLDGWEGYYEKIDDSFFQIEIKRTWLAVIHFIKWYNENEK